MFIALSGDIFEIYKTEINMILDKIKEFRKSGNRTVVSFSMSDTFSLCKKSELAGKTGGAKQCQSDFDQAQSDDASSEKSNSTQNGNTPNENSCNSDGENSSASASENTTASASENSSTSSGENGSSSGGTCGSSDGEDCAYVPKSSSTCKCGTSSSVSGSVTCSHSCDVLLCDLIAGALLTKLIIKIIKMI